LVKEGNPSGGPADNSMARLRSNPQSLDPREHRPSLYLLLLFLIVAAGIVAAGNIFYSNYARDFLVEVEHELSSIAELKASQLVQWRKERLADASVFYRNRAFAGLVERLFEAPTDTEVRSLIIGWLDQIKDAYEYDRVFILDTQGIERVAAPVTPEPVASHLLQQIPEILRLDKATFLDLHRDALDRPIHLSLVVPVRRPDGSQPLGILVLRIDPSIHLYPLVQQWPSPSRTAEFLLVRRDGNDVLFLSELKFQKDAALELRIPLTSTDLPCVKAALGQEGIMKGLDYRGVAVLADVRGIPGSPWFLIARMDIAEVQAPLRERLWLIVGLVGALLFGAGMAAALIWRQQRVRFFRERLAAAKTLYDVSSRHEALVSAVPDIIMEVDQNKVYTWANPAGIEFFGENVIGKEAAFYFEGEQETYQKVQPLFEGQGEVIYVESWQRRKDGEKRLLAWWCRVLKDEGGRVIGAISSGRDITESMRAEEALRESEEKFRNLFNNAVEGVYQTTSDGRLITVNMAFARMLGYESPEEMMRTVTDIAHQLYADPDDRKMVVRILRETGFLKGLEFQMRKKDGSVIWVSANARLNKSPDGGSNFEGFITDITRRKEAEERLRENEAKYRAIIETNQEWIWRMDNKGIHTYSNPAIEQILGYSVEDIVGKDATAYMNPEDRRKIGEMLPGWIENKTGWGNLIVRWVHKDGSMRWLESDAVPLLDARGELIGFQGSDRDITERMQAEEALRSSLREKEVLLREIHHRVKNNMQVISSLFSLQSGHTTNEECRGILKEAQTRIRSMSLVHEKLYRSPDLSKIDLTGYIQTLAAHLLQVYLIRPEKVRMETEFEDVSVDINSAVPCGLILNELISNALKHAFPAGRKGVIKIRLRRGPEGRVELRVADDGVGLPAGLDLRKAKTFGLQIVNLLVDQLEGAIDVDRTNGTAVTLTFQELTYAPRPS